MKFDAGTFFNQSAVRDGRGRTVEEQDDLEAQLRAARNLSGGGPVDESQIVSDFELGDRSGLQDLRPDTTTAAGNTRSEDRLNPSVDTDHADLERAAAARALELMTQGQIDLDATRENIRAQSQEGIGQTVGNANARLAAGGFGASGVQQNIEGTIRSQGAISENEAILAAERSARDENLRNILAGSQLSMGERGLQADLDDKARKNQAIEDILDGITPPGSSSNQADLDSDGFVNFGEGSLEAYNWLARFFGASQSQVDRNRDNAAGRTIEPNG